MRRREFITPLGSAVAAAPFASLAQQSGRVPRLGFLARTLTFTNLLVETFR